MKFALMFPLYYHEVQKKYVAAKSEILINLSQVKTISYHSWEDDKGNKHEYREVLLIGDSHQSGIKITESQFSEYILPSLTVI